MNYIILFIVTFSVFIVSSHGYFRTANILIHNRETSPTAIFAHHVNKKITKRMMDRRPKKSRPSDINRNNVNFNKCITKIENAPREYSIVSAEDYMKVREQALKFWEEGDPEAEWIQITEEDKMVALPQNTEPLPIGGVQKKPPLVRSGSC